MTHRAKAKSTRRNTVKSCSVTLEDIADIQNLYDAYISARKSKRKSVPCFEFELDLMVNLNDLRRSILDGSYTPEEPFEFRIYCNAGKKYRDIAAPAFEDCVVQHAIYQLVYESFDRKFIYDSYGCRPGKGNHRASKRCQKFMRQCSGDEYYLQIDMKKYYNSMKHGILQESLERTIEDQRVVELMMSFTRSGISGDVGTNIGNLMAQLYGMIYLDRFDHYCKRVLKIKRYIRYVDDIVFIGQTKRQARHLRAAVVNFLFTHLKMRLSKWRISKIKKGINFVGYRTWRSKRFIRKRSLHSFSRFLKICDLKRVESILAHAINTNSYRHLLDRIIDSLPYKKIKKFNKRIHRDLRIRYVQRRRADRDNPITC